MCLCVACLSLSLHPQLTWSENTGATGNDTIVDRFANAPVPIAAFGGQTSEFALADFNGDGYSDAAWATYHEEAS